MRETARKRLIMQGLIALVAFAAVTLASAAIVRADGGHGNHANANADGGVSGNVGASANGNVQAGGTVTATANGGVGHTPVTICHWVPAHGGSFITITIDDDGL